jgi:hypothetical protein
VEKGILTLIDIAFIHRHDNPYLCGQRPNNNFEKFYLKALRKQANVTFIYGDEINCKDITGHDVYLFFDTIDWGIPKLKHIEALNGLKVVSINDAHSCEAKGKNGKTRREMLFEIGYDYCYYQHTPEYFNKFYPTVTDYWWIPIGFDAKLYENIIPFQERMGKNVLLTGINGDGLYDFRMLCSKHPFAKYIAPGSYEKKRYTPSANDQNGYKHLLENYKFAIASGYQPANKYYEIPAAGCLCVAHIDHNNGCEIMGFEDKKTAMFINEKNYDEVLSGLVYNHDREELVEMAKNGRKFAFDNFTHEKCVERLINHIEEVL